jgi:hypothetical protein
MAVSAQHDLEHAVRPGRQNPLTGGQRDAGCLQPRAGQDVGVVDVPPGGISEDVGEMAFHHRRHFGHRDGAAGLSG